jgi:hypothetical protein
MWKIIQFHDATYCTCTHVWKMEKKILLNPWSNLGVVSQLVAIGLKSKTSIVFENGFGYKTYEIHIQFAHIYLSLWRSL